MILAKFPHRGIDDWGSGEFKASRGSRTHKGIDYACCPDTAIRASFAGTVTKLGYPYADDLSYRYVQITDSRGYDHRYFYVSPSVEVGREIEAMDVIGNAQDIAKRYTKPDKIMRNHIHYEILYDGVPTDPEEFA